MYRIGSIVYAFWKSSALVHGTALHASCHRAATWLWAAAAFLVKLRLMTEGAYHAVNSNALQLGACEPS